MRYEFKPTDMEDGSQILGVRMLWPHNRFVGWIRSLPSGWVLVGYHDKPLPFYRTPQEAADALVERDAEEIDTEDWPVYMSKT